MSNRNRQTFAAMLSNEARDLILLLQILKRRKRTTCTTESKSRNSAMMFLELDRFSSVEQVKRGLYPLNSNIFILTGPLVQVSGKKDSL